LGLRVKVQGGGCSGMIYDLSFDDYTDKDMVFHTKDNFHVIVDKRSILYLAGSDITYEDGLMGTGFVIKNPKANSKTSGFLPIEREWMDKLIEHGYIDTFRYVNGDKEEEYSWWSYRSGARAKNVGWRIDYFFISDDLVELLEDAFILQDVMGSDHCPVGIKLDI